MVSTLKLQTDLHIHTIASGHAYSTVDEIARAAAEKGLRGIALTDHGPALPGGPHPYHFHALRFIPEFLYGVRVLRGAEANIMGAGEIDLPDDVLPKLDVVMAGFHEDCSPVGNTAQNTEVLLAIMDRPQIKVISHPGNPSVPLDLEAVAEHAAKTGTALEFNNSSFTISRIGSDSNCRRLAYFCAAHHTPVTVGSDAHFHSAVGELSVAQQALSEGGVEPEQIINRTLESTLAFLNLEF